MRIIFARFSALVVLACSAALLGGCGSDDSGSDTQSKPAPTQARAASKPSHPIVGLPDFSGLVKEVSPAVVNVSAMPAAAGAGAAAAAEEAAAAAEEAAAAAEGAADEAAEAVEGAAEDAAAAVEGAGDAAADAPGLADIFNEDGFDMDVALEAVENADISAPVRLAVTTALEGARDNPELLGGAIQAARAALGIE